MNKLESPIWFNDHAALEALAKNKRAISYPGLAEEVATILTGYDGYIAANGNAFNVPPVILPDSVSENLRKQYASPTRDIPHIKRLRSETPRSCAMCGSLHNGTLDHIMPKGDYASYAIFGPNLVPACSCNSDRGTVLTGENEGERILHPYFDDVLGQRLLSARFEDLGMVPRLTIRVLLRDDHPQRSAVDFHLKKVVLKSGIEREMRENWSDLVRGPWMIARDFGKALPSRQEIADILQMELAAHDDRYRSKNNWASIFVHGLLDEDVLDWLFDAFNRPGRMPGAPLIAEIGAQTVPI